MTKMTIGCRQVQAAPVVFHEARICKKKRQTLHHPTPGSTFSTFEAQELEAVDLAAAHARQEVTAKLRLENARRAEQAGQFGSKTVGYAAVALGCRRRWT
jgi:hypothetical protein